jgi:hypothetical protein
MATKYRGVVLGALGLEDGSFTYIPLSISL